MKKTRTSTILFLIFLLSNVQGQISLNTKSQLYTIDGTKYISALEYGQIQNIRTIFYQDKQKLELILGWRQTSP